MSLRPYQLTALAEARAAVVSGRRAPLVVIPTGGGKTRTATEAVRGHVERNGRVLWMAHRRELIDQAADTLRGAGLDVGTLGRESPVTVASVQTILARGEAPRVSMVVLDEAHHYVAAEWKKVGDAYADAIKLGLTATPERADGKGLGDIFDHLVVAVQPRELIRDGWLVPCAVRRPAEPLDRNKIAQWPDDAYVEHAPDGRAVVFAPHVLGAREYAARFEARGIRARVVTGEMPADERARILREFKAGALRVVVNVYVLTEGWDAPIADTCILARGCGSHGMFLQMVGRVMRPAPGKAGAMLLDLRGVTHVFGAPDEDRVYSLDGRGIRRKVDAEALCRSCGKLAAECACEAGVGDALEMPGVAGVGLVDWRDRMATLPTNKLAVMLAKFMRDAREKGHNARAAMHRFRGTTKRWPDAGLIAEAQRINRERGAT